MLTVIALGLLFLAVTISGFLATINATNHGEQHRASRLAEAALKAQMGALGAIAEDNVVWDDAALELYSGGDGEAYFEETWADYTPDNTSYDMVLLADENANAIAGTERGEYVKPDIRKKFGKATADRLASLTFEAPHLEMLVLDEHGLAVLVASVIRYATADNNAALAGAKPRILVFKKHLPPKVIADLGKQYNVPGLTYHRNAVDDHSLPITGGGGAIVGYLSWDDPTAGYVAAEGSLPTLLIGSLLFFVALAFGARGGFAMIQSLSNQAYTDSLSRMPNRRALRGAIRQEQEKNGSYALALIDLDGFKYVNDSYGHAVGDRLIKQISEMLKQQVGEEGVVARLGGDEFAILLAECDAARRIEVIARKFLQGLDLPVMVDDRLLSIGASIGLAATSETLQDEGELLRRADIAMYQAKRLGKMQVQWYDPKLDEDQTKANELAEELRVSLAKGDLTVVYQPIVGAKDRRFQSVEALARWNSPTLGAVPPDIFIPIAENSGLIDAVGLFVLRRACSDLSSWSDVRLAVNVSAGQLRNPMFPDHLKAILQETNFDATRLELEITETYLIADTSLAKKVIEGVAALGVTISLDDFGTGYASIGFLRQFEFAKLKIDQSLVREAQHDEAARMLVQVSVAAARALNMVVTAEGVETDAQADLMKVAGCDQLQGWYFGRAVEYDELKPILTGSADANVTTG